MQKKATTIFTLSKTKKRAEARFLEFPIL